MDEVKRERERDKRWMDSRNYVSECDCTSVLGSDLSVLESRHGADMQFGPCSDPTAIWFQTCLLLHLFPGLDPTKLGPRPGTESNLSPGPNPNRSRTWHRIQHVPRPGPNCSLVPGLDPIPTCPQTWTQFGHRPGSEIGTQRFY